MSGRVAVVAAIEAALLLAAAGLAAYGVRVQREAPRPSPRHAVAPLAVEAGAAAPRPVPQWPRLAPPLVATLSPPRPAFAGVIRAAAFRHGIAPSLVEAVARVESDFNPREVSEKGALGLMQLMPETARRFGVMRHELFDPERNVAAGTAYLSWLLDRYHGDLDLALAGYNAGEGAVDNYGGIPPYPETREYIRRVHAVLDGRAGAARPPAPPARLPLMSVAF